MDSRYLSTLLLMLSLVACDHQEVDVYKCTNGSVNLRINSIVADDANLLETTTKAEATGNFSPLQSAKVGLFVCDHFDGADGNPYTPHANGMNNICAEHYYSTNEYKWRFTLSSFSTSYPSLVITSKQDDDDNNINADVFAYYPYSASVTSPESVPFNVGIELIENGNYDTYYRDYLYAMENSSTSVNKNIDPTAVDEHGTKIQDVDVNFSFRHAMAKITFNVSIKNSQYNHPDENGASKASIDKIILRKNASGHLYKSGKMNSITGELYDLESADSLLVAGCSKTGIKRMVSTIVPTQIGEDYQDDDYYCSFVIDGVEISSVFELKREQLRHYDAGGNPTNVFGFKAGYSYTFNLVYDNFIRLEGVEIDSWTVEEEPLYEIEI